MAVITGTQAAATNPARYQEKGVYTIVDTYETAAMAQNDVYICARIVPGSSVVTGSFGFDALGANTKVKLGLYSDAGVTAVDDDCFIVSAATTSAGVTNFNGSISTSFRNDSTSDYYVGYKQDDTGTATGTVRITLLLTGESTDQT